MIVILNNVHHSSHKTVSHNVDTKKIDKMHFVF